MHKTYKSRYDTIILGGGAAGLMCAIEIGKRGRAVLVIEHCAKVGKKILISGGGRCNFTNLHIGPHAYQSNNNHFSRSALSRYTQEDFIDLVEKYGIAYYEKTAGQLFCKKSSREIVDLLLRECSNVNVDIRCDCHLTNISKFDSEFKLETTKGRYRSTSFVVASGGISIPQMGATDIGYDIAGQFHIAVTKRQAGLVPFIFSKKDLTDLDGLAGISIAAEVSCRSVKFRESILFTHRGISGPAILQISSYWQQHEPVTLNFLPDIDMSQTIHEKKGQNKNLEVKTVLTELLPKRFVNRVFQVWLRNKPLKQLTTKDISDIASFFHHWQIIPVGTEGYRKAEVTLGGIDTDEISSKTFECKRVPGLFFIGEVLDVTGWLGGYNFQWAWSSGFCAGHYA